MLRAGVTTFGFLYRAALADALESIAAGGYRLVEIAPPGPSDAGERKALAQRLDRLGLECASINPPELNLVSPNPEIRDLGLSNYMAAIDLACELGARVVVVIAGRRSQLVPMPYQEALELALTQVSALARHARGRSVRLAVETVPFGFNETAAEVAAMVERIGDEQVGIALDVANIFGREDVDTAVDMVAGRLLVAHLSDTWRGRWAHTSIGAGEVDFPAYIHALERAGFDGPVIYELADDEDPAPRIGPDLERLKAWGLSG